VLGGTEPESQERITIVYFVSLVPDNNVPFLMQGQLADLREFGLLERAEIHIVLQRWRGDNESESDYSQRCEGARAVAHSTEAREVHVHEPEGNLFEYYGIHLVWRLACSIVDDKGVFLYLHSKGITHQVFDKEHPRYWEEKVLMDSVVAPWRTVLQIFRNHSEVNTVGLVSAHPDPPWQPSVGECGNPGSGWQWFNFWWARTSYLKRLVEPMVTENKYFYESWLAYVRKTGTDCPSQPLDIKNASNVYGRVELCKPACPLGSRSGENCVEMVDLGVSGAFSLSGLKGGVPVAGKPLHDRAVQMGLKPR
jgi:hypothetical protein